MSKPLSDMSLEELWKLFPIQLTEHQACWEDWFQIEKNASFPSFRIQLKSIILAVRRSMRFGQNQWLFIHGAN